eukprot:scaffold23653_cov96-Phaeocystis_antarctica.AAC.5
MTAHAVPEPVELVLGAHVDHHDPAVEQLGVGPKDQRRRVPEMREVVQVAQRQHVGIEVDEPVSR